MTTPAQPPQSLEELKERERELADFLSIYTEDGWHKRDYLEPDFTELAAVRERIAQLEQETAT